MLHYDFSTEWARGELAHTGEPGVGDALTCDPVTRLNQLELHWIRANNTVVTQKLVTPVHVIV